MNTIGEDYVEEEAEADGVCDDVCDAVSRHVFVAAQVLYSHTYIYSIYLYE